MCGLELRFRWPEFTLKAGNICAYVYDCENNQKKMTTPMLEVTTYAYGGDGLRRSCQKPGLPVRTMVWDGSDYMGEI